VFSVFKNQLILYMLYAINDLVLLIYNCKCRFKCNLQHKNHRNSRTGPQIAAYIFDLVTVFKYVSATSKYLLVLFECMDSKNILSIEPNLPLLKLVKFYGIIKKDKE
jgi:hypothetical protein